LHRAIIRDDRRRAIIAPLTSHGSSHRIHSSCGLQMIIYDRWLRPSLTHIIPINN